MGHLANPAALLFALLVLCVGTGHVESITALQHPGELRATSTGWLNDSNNDTSSCLQDPTAAACASYTYPDADIHADLESLCHAMPYMPTCSIRYKCMQSGADAVSNIKATCAPFNLLTTICKLDSAMSTMRGCTNYRQLCSNPASRVPQCKAFAGHAYLPTTDEANDLTRGICTEMTMDGCENCTADWMAGKHYSSCALVEVYSYLCYSMPDMSQCGMWATMCHVDPSLYLCNGSKDPTGGGFKPGPVMRMYFNLDRPFYLLFRTWTPTSEMDLISAWLLVFAVACLYEALQVLKLRYEAWTAAATARLQQEADKTAEAAEAAEAGAVQGAGVAQQQQRPQQQTRLLGLGFDLGRSAFVFVNMSISYALMLAAMSFNVPIYFAVCGGMAVGSFLFGRFRPLVTFPRDDACCTSS